MKHLGPCLAAILAVTACGKPAAPPRPTPVDPEPKRSPDLERVMPLIIGGAPTTGGTWARLYGYDRAWLRRGGAPAGENRDATGWAEIVAVAEVADDAVRVLHDEDGARVLIWIPTDDLANAFVARAGIALDATAPLPTGDGPGVVALAGSRLEVRDPIGERTGVTIRDEQLELDGFTDTAAIGAIWEGTLPTAAEATHYLASDTKIQLAPAPDAPILAYATGTADVRVIAVATDGWAEIESVGPFVLARGFVPEDALEPVEPGDAIGNMWGKELPEPRTGMIELDLPAGACLYDLAEGEPLGQNLVAKVRLARASESPGWWMVLVDSPWGMLEVAAHRGADDAWAMCNE